MRAYLSPEQKAQYKKAVEAWFQQASDADLDQLDVALEQHQTNEVRTLVSFLRESLADAQHAQLIPGSLVEQLTANGLPLAAAA
jgi:hypothetical protein